MCIESVDQAILLHSPKLEVALTFDTSTFDLCLSGVFSRRTGASTLVGGVADFKTKKESLLVVSRGSSQSDKIQTVGLLPPTMRRISRARSIVSGVEL